MTHSQFRKIIDSVRELHYDYEDGIPEDAAYDMARSIIADNKGLEAFINENCGASDAVDWLVCKM